MFKLPNRITNIFIILSILLISSLILIPLIKNKIDKVLTKKVSTLYLSYQQNNTANQDIILKGLQDKISKYEKDGPLISYAYQTLYSNLRRNRFLFDLVMEKLERSNVNKVEINEIRKICNFELEESTEKIYLAKVYYCLSHPKIRNNGVSNSYNAIKDASYALDIIYSPEYSQNLAKIIVAGHEKKFYQKLRKLVATIY